MSHQTGIMLNGSVMNLGKAIKLGRVQRGCTQAELAEKSDISVSYLSLIERGKRDPNFSTLENIAAALRIPLSILVFLASDPGELDNVSPELVEKLSRTALELIARSNGETDLHPETNSVD